MFFFLFLLCTEYIVTNATVLITERLYNESFYKEMTFITKPSLRPGCIAIFALRNRLQRSGPYNEVHIGSPKHFAMKAFDCIKM